MKVCRVGAWARGIAVLALVALAAGATSLGAQQDVGTTLAAGPETPFPPGVSEVDRIVAVVGDTAILLSELRHEMFRLRSEGARIPPEGTAEWTSFARQVIEAATDRLIILQQAKRAGITPNPAMVEEMAEDYYQRARSGFQTDEELMRVVEASGMNMLQYRQMLRSQAEAEALLQAYRFSLQQRTDLPPVVVNESEVEAYFRERVGDQRRPALVSFNQLLVMPVPTGAAKDSAIARAERALAEIEAGEDFEVVARRYSDDEGTRQQGGELGWLRRQDVVKPFGDAAWRVRPGNVAGPVQTRFGLHIIKVENQRGGDRFIRHILIRPEIKESDIEDARALAAQFADSLRAGVEPERLMRDGAVIDERIRFDDIPVQQLASRFSGEYAVALSSPKEGEVYGPLEVAQGGQPQFAVVHVLRYRPEGPVALDDVRDRIRREIRLTRQIDALLKEIRANTYIDIKL